MMLDKFEAATNAIVEPETSSQEKFDSRTEAHAAAQGHRMEVFRLVPHHIGTIQVIRLEALSHPETLRVS